MLYKNTAIFIFLLFFSAFVYSAEKDKFSILVDSYSGLDQKLNIKGTLGKEDTILYKESAQNLKNMVASKPEEAIEFLLSRTTDYDTQALNIIYQELFANTDQKLISKYVVGVLNSPFLNIRLRGLMPLCSIENDKKKMVMWMLFSITNDKKRQLDDVAIKNIINFFELSGLVVGNKEFTEWLKFVSTNKAHPLYYYALSDHIFTQPWSSIRKRLFSVLDDPNLKMNQLIQILPALNMKLLNEYTAKQEKSIAATEIVSPRDLSRITEIMLKHREILHHNKESCSLYDVDFFNSQCIYLSLALAINDNQTKGELLVLFLQEAPLNVVVNAFVIAQQRKFDTVLFTEKYFQAVCERLFKEGYPQILDISISNLQSFTRIILKTSNLDDSQKEDYKKNLFSFLYGN